MKKILLLFIGCILSQFIFAQTPEAISYQAVARDATGAIIANQNAGFRISILQGSLTGTVVYAESHVSMTNQFGLVTLEIGRGTVIDGSFAAIGWGNDQYFIKTEMDPAGGSDYQLMGTSQLLSVPYALFAKKALSGGNSYSPGTGLSLDGNTFNSVWTASDNNIFNNNSANTGIGTNNPMAKFSVGSNSEFQVNGGGNLVKINNVTTSFPSSQGASNTYLKNNGSGTLSWSSIPGLLPSGTSGQTLRHDGTGWVSNSLFNNDGTRIAIGPLSDDVMFDINNGTVSLFAVEAPSSATGIGNVIAGLFAGDSLTTGTDNTFFGYYAGACNKTGDWNVAVGTSALHSNSSGWSNSALGYGALMINNTGIGNCAFGYYSLMKNTIGEKNSAYGVQSLYKNTSGNYNMAIGYNSMFNNLTGSNNVAVGRSALSANTTGNNSIALGNYALHNQEGFPDDNDLNNIAIGYEAMYSTNPTSTANGRYNLALGHMALRNNTTGHHNISIGYLSGVLNQTGNEILTIGDSAGYNNTANENLFIGHHAGQSNSDGSKNHFIGYRAGESNTSGNENHADGFMAFHSNEGGFANSAVGFHAMLLNISGSGNSAFGNRSLISNTTGFYNVAVGLNALASNSEGYSNTAIGAAALFANGLGGYNSAVGDVSLKSNTTGSRNSALGNSALRHNETGENNTAVGSLAGYSNITGTGNIFLGYQAGYNEMGSNRLYITNSSTIYPLIWGDMEYNRLVINGNGGDNYNNRNLYVYGPAGGTSAWYNDSDGNSKKNVSTIASPLEKVMKLRGVNYEWKEIEHHVPGLQMGFIAQEVEQVIPEVVSNTDGHYSMQYAPVTALLVEALKQQQKTIEELQKRIEMLEKK